MRTLAAGGAQVALCASNPLSTQDDVAAALVVEFGISTFARRGVDRDGYYAHLNAVADTRPQLTMDDGCDLVSLLHSDRRDRARRTSWPAPRRRRPASSGCARWPPTARSSSPIVAVNEALTKHLFDNRYGTGQSTIDGILRATNILLAGRRVVVAGYGWCGRGIASRMRGMGAQVIDHRGRPDPGHRGADGRLRGHGLARGRRLGRPLHHRDGQPERVPRRSTSKRMQRRRDPGQQRPLRRRDWIWARCAD